MPWPRRIRITRGQGSLNRFALIIWAEDLSFSGLSPESLCTLFQDRNASTKPRPATEAAADLGEQFLCPVCETLVSADATVCPGCGAEFSEGESTEYECPVCKASVPADADRCPSCGVRFAEDAQTAGAP